MGWRDLLQAEDERVTVPWTGGFSLRTRDRTWTIEGRLPREEGWHEFKLNGRKATWVKSATPFPEILVHKVKGYLVGDRILPDGVRCDTDPLKLLPMSERVHMIEPGLDRFVRIVAGRWFEGGPLVFESQDFPLGPEDAVLDAFLESKPTVDSVPGVVPALDAAFRLETWRKLEAERIRIEEAARRAREEEERQRAERRQRIAEALGDGAGRREMAAIDFGEAAKAALALSGAQYLDHRESYNAGEMVVRFRLNRRRFECVCDSRTLRIVDAGICLTSHETGEKGDARFTLESLPSVILEAERDGVLVVFRHVN